MAHGNPVGATYALVIAGEVVTRLDYRSKFTRLVCLDYKVTIVG